MAKQTLTPEEKEQEKTDKAIRKLLNGKSYILIINSEKSTQTMVGTDSIVTALGMLEMGKKAIYDSAK